MARKLDQLLVIDLEATCWEGSTPPDQVHEIIEIGICPLDTRTGEVGPRRSVLVRPELSAISPFCTALTSITPAMVEAEGVTLQQALTILKKEYEAPRRLWASWGDYDRRQLDRECREKGLGYPMGPTHLNVKPLFSLAHGLEREVGMAAALEVAGLALDGTHHRGADDAYNIACLLRHLLTRLRQPLT